MFARRSRLGKMSYQSSPQRQSSNGGSHYQPALGVVVILLILFVGATFLMLRSTSASTSTPLDSATTVPTTNPSSSSSSSPSTTVPRNKVRVQVANGTSVSGLARNYTQQLVTTNWDALPQVNGPRVTSTTIYYNPGFLWAAQQVATQLKIAASSIQPLNGLTPVPGASGDDVIVILGPDVAIKG